MYEKQVGTLHIDSPSEIIHDSDGFDKVIVTPITTDPLPPEKWFTYNVNFMNRAPHMQVTRFIEQLIEIGYRVDVGLWSEIERKQDRAVPIVATNTGILMSLNVDTSEGRTNSNVSCSLPFNGPLYATTSYRVFMLAASLRAHPDTYKGQLITVCNSNIRKKFTMICTEDDPEVFVKKLPGYSPQMMQTYWRTPTFEEILHNNKGVYGEGKMKYRCHGEGCETCRYNKSCRWQHGNIDNLEKFLIDEEGEQMFF